MCKVSESLERLILNSGVSRKSAYTTGEVSKILSSSISMVIIMCEDWSAEEQKGLECYMVGTHRRIPHHALLEWLTLNRAN